MAYTKPSPFRLEVSRNPLHLAQAWGERIAAKLGLRSVARLGCNGKVISIEIVAGNAERLLELAEIHYNVPDWWPCMVGNEIVERREDFTAALNRQYEARYGKIEDPAATKEPEQAASERRAD